MDSRKAKVVVLRLIGAWIFAPVVWYVIAMSFSGMVYAICHGRPVFGPYGRDKSLSNVAIEFPIVMILTTIAFPFTSPGTEGRWWPRAALIICLIAGLVTVLIPGLPE